VRVAPQATVNRIPETRVLIMASHIPPIPRPITRGRIVGREGRIGG
jgi:hypothetical protein